MVSVNDGNQDVDFQVGTASTDNMIRTDAANDRVGINIAVPLQTFHVNGTIRQSATGTVLVADANGDIIAASNLADIAYVPVGAGGLEPYTPLNPANWLGPPPPTLEEAIQRLATQVAALGGPIP